jgi:hypothetical protein
MTKEAFYKARGRLEYRFKAKRQNAEIRTRQFLSVRK